MPRNFRSELAAMQAEAHEEYFLICEHYKAERLSRPYEAERIEALKDAEVKQHWALTQYFLDRLNAEWRHAVTGEWGKCPSKPAFDVDLFLHRLRRQRAVLNAQEEERRKKIVAAADGKEALILLLLQLCMTVAAATPARRETVFYDRLPAVLDMLGKNDPKDPAEGTEAPTKRLNKKVEVETPTQRKKRP